MVSYEGIFFDGEMAKLIHSLEEVPLEIVNDNLHCTFKYHPSEREIFNNLMGEEFEVYIIGYGNDGNNSGFEIMLPKELRKYYINFDEKNRDVLKIPHITTSLSCGARANNTKNLNFRKLENPVKVVGKFGLWIKEGNKEYLSYTPYFSKKI